MADLIPSDPEAGYTFGINKVDEHNGLLTAEKAPMDEFFSPFDW